MLFVSTIQAQTALAPDWRWPNFSIAELACRCAGRFCSGAYWHDPDFLDGLQSLRDRVQAPLVVTSAHRCPQWNAAVGGAPLSQHKRIAVDISLRRHDRQRLFSAARVCGFKGFGLARSFLHLDRRAHEAVWYYPGSVLAWQN